ncbi:MAG: helix-turn-helix domain-containing protein [Desulfobaccales bacterium]
MSDLFDKLKISFKDKDYRHGYVDEFLNVSIATQIKVLREQRGWTQEELAKYAKMKQPRISVMESVNYSSWSINTLRKLAETFDLTLRVSFESFGSRLKDIEQLNRETLKRPSFKNDPTFIEKEERKTAKVIEKVMGDFLQSNKNVVHMAEWKSNKEQIRAQKENTVPKGFERQTKEELSNEIAIG